MTQIQKIAALSTVAFGVALGPSVFAQDDLDDLLKELDGEVKAETPAPAAKEETPAPETPVAETPVTETPAPETPVAETPVAETPASETPVAETPAPETPAPETPATEEPAAETPATETPAVETPATEEPAAVVAEEPAKPAVSPDDELIENIVTTEKIRRKALDAQAKRNMKEAHACMKTGQFEDAVRYFGSAEKLLGEGPQAKALRDECEMGIASGLYRQAMADWDLGLREKAIDGMMQARERRHPKAQRILEKWQAVAAAAPDEKDDLSAIRHGRSDEEYKAKSELIRKHLRRSKQYLSMREIDKALEECDLVLVHDKYNEEALRIRNAIGKKRQFIREKEREATRENMIADVDGAWRPAYTVNATQLDDTASETVKAQTGEDPERTQEQEIVGRMKAMRLPNISFKPPATIIDAVDFFRQASRDYDRPDIPAEKRGFNFVLRTPPGAIKTQNIADSNEDFTANASNDEAQPTNGLEPIQTIMASDISFYEAMKLVCDSVRYKFIVNGQVIMIMPQEMSTAELIARKYNVPDAFVERVNNAADEIKTMGGTGFGGTNRRAAQTENAEEGEGQDWKAFFEEMGVAWPEGSSIKHIKSLNKLYVRNTRENLAEFEKVLDELGAQTPLIEIETRFVEVSQEDLNSLGFEWILNSDYTVGVGGALAKALDIGEATWGSESGSFKNSLSTSGSTIDGYTIGSNGTRVPSADSGTTYRGVTGFENSYTREITPRSVGGGLIQDAMSGRMIGVNAIGGVSDFSKTTDSDGNRMYSSGGRYLSTTGNMIAGQGNAYNDQFMKVNAFLGNADLSLILHMLAQRSDTDLLSAPKVVTKSGENAVIKVVTEYIYPQDYNVQLQSSSSSSSSSGGGSQSAILAIVEPQNFQTREVGVILDVTPTYSEANGGTIDLELKPQVVDEPTWKNYGMKIPFTGNANNSALNITFPAAPFNNAEPSDPALKESIIADYWNAVATMYRGLVGGGSNNNITYYDAPMEQPFFHVRSIDSKVSITPGATVVMGGLITESRKAMDDKIPFLGDLPFVGRLFRSHAEQTIKRNLLIFVTGRLITPAGRELKMNEQSVNEGEVKAAPSAN